MKKLLCLISIISLVSCSNTQEDNDNIALTTIKERFNKLQKYGEPTYGEISLLHDVTIEDSLAYYAQQIILDIKLGNTIESIQEMISSNQNKLDKYNLELEKLGQNSRRTFLENETQNMVESINGLKDLLSRYTQALKGEKIDINNWDYSINWKKTIQNINHYWRLKKRNQKEIIGKIYSCDIVLNVSSTSKPVWNQHHFHHLSADSKIYITSMSDAEATKRSRYYIDIEPEPDDNGGFLPDTKYIADFENYRLKYIEAGITSNSENSKAEELIFLSSEFIGYCMVRFKNKSGQEIEFINPNLGNYSSKDNECELQKQYQDKKFMIEYEKGTVNIYIEDLEEESATETYIIKSIELIK